MKFRFFRLFVITCLLATPVVSIAADLSADTLAGKWLFTHILMDGGESKIQVNNIMEFARDGSVINYDAAGSEKSRATFAITENLITYSDSNGKQKWKVISFEDNALHVDHRGAEMFFERQ